MKFYLPIFLLAFLVLTVFLPRWRVMQATGKNPFVVPRDDSPQGYVGRVFRFIFLLVLVAVGVSTFIPQVEKYLLPVFFLETEIVQLVGWILLHLSLSLIVIAQHQMRQSWRIGFDASERTQLIETGLFRYSRNPIFVGILLVMLGLFLVLSNALTLLALVLTWVVLQVQARMEEAYLRKVQGVEYERYCQKVRRWL